MDMKTSGTSARLQNGGPASEPKFITECAPILRREKLSQAVYDNLLKTRVEVGIG